MRNQSLFLIIMKTYIVTPFSKLEKNSSDGTENFDEINAAITSFLKKPSILAELEKPFEKVLGYNFFNKDLNDVFNEKVKELIASGRMFKIDEYGKMIVLE